MNFLRSRFGNRLTLSVFVSDPIVANHYFVIYIGIHINGERTLRKVKLKCRILDIDCIVMPILAP